MPRLAVVSNRVPEPDGGANAGGLVTALSAALEERGGLWFGWSGRTCGAPDPAPQLSDTDGFRLATLDLTDDEVEGYYNRLANRALWPAFHGRLDLVRVDHCAYTTYREVNRRFAAALAPLLRGDDTVWVQDYHLIPLGHELRWLGVTAPIGFFLHIPFPPAETFAALPWADELARALAAYDLVGLQTQGCVENFLTYMDRAGPGAASSDGWVSVDGHVARVEAHPIGIDTRRFARLAASRAVAARVERIRRRIGERLLIAGVERLDYSKGIAEHFRAMETLLERYPEYAGRAMLYQVTAPSRLEVPEYQATKAELESLSGRINARFATFDWSPIRYLNRPINHVLVAALLRTCRVGLVTPLADGMNLVAKEYVAAQVPDDPGVLILSTFAGAAEELPEALIVNPYDAEAMAQALCAALEMPLAERRQRWQAMMRRLETHDVHRWQRRFLDSLASLASLGERRRGRGRSAVQAAAKAKPLEPAFKLAPGATVLRRDAPERERDRETAGFGSAKAGQREPHG